MGDKKTMELGNEASKEDSSQEKEAPKQDILKQRTVVAWNKHEIQKFILA